ncbi:hypothetical protein CPT_Moabite_033 [Serratia phage Moabite]|uniref:Uncharacterized protein n=1 Tax=Serratia phage Moabite TaxID=2587814 RepID=A0A4Y5TNW9_9CAUD|nr:hypothetical protein HWC48_gp033 [Serratia phage Moabite]QDB71065.1 hypothetical protein CPT_Moabite_033 [Serratia phage Moabite]
MLDLRSPPGRHSKRIVLYLDYKEEIHDLYLSLSKDWGIIGAPRLLIEGAINSITASTPPKVILKELSEIIMLVRNPFFQKENWDMNNWMSDALVFYGMFQKFYAHVLIARNLTGEYSVSSIDFSQSSIRLMLEKP